VGCVLTAAGEESKTKLSKKEMKKLKKKVSVAYHWSLHLSEMFHVEKSNLFLCGSIMLAVVAAVVV